jgi:hypothetical protein
MDVVGYLKEWFTKFFGILKSRKFLAAVGATVAAVQASVDLETQVQAIAAIWIAYIFSVAYEDAARAGTG